MQWALNFRTSLVLCALLCLFGLIGYRARSEFGAFAWPFVLFGGATAAHSYFFSGSAVDAVIVFPVLWLSASAQLYQAAEANVLAKGLGALGSGVLAGMFALWVFQLKEKGRRGSVPRQ
jgi:hypothetical protein